MTNYIFKSKILLLSIGFILIDKASLKAQSNITIDASQMLTNFKFTDDQGAKDKSYTGSYSGAYSIGYRHTGEKGLLLRGGVGMRKAGANLVYDAMNYSWNLQYLDVKLGVGWMFGKGRAKPYISASPYYAFLLKATQVLNNQYFNILDSKSLKTSDYGVFITPGVQFKASDAISVYGEFNYMLGLQNLETSASEKSYNRAYSLTLGVAFTITKPKK